MSHRQYSFVDYSLCACHMCTFCSGCTLFTLTQTTTDDSTNTKLTKPNQKPLTSVRKSLSSYFSFIPPAPHMMLRCRRCRRHVEALNACVNNECCLVSNLLIFNVANYYDNPNFASRFPNSNKICDLMIIIQHSANICDYGGGGIYHE